MSALLLVGDAFGVSGRLILLTWLGEKLGRVVEAWRIPAWTLQIEEMS